MICGDSLSAGSLVQFIQHLDEYPIRLNLFLDGLQFSSVDLATKPDVEFAKINLSYVNALGQEEFLT
jgi:hypothetical protein